MRLNLSVLSPCTGVSYALEEQIQDNPTSVLWETSGGGGGVCDEDRQAL